MNRYADSLKFYKNNLTVSRVVVIIKQKFESFKHNFSS